ncbi:cortical protein marker for cell polarity-domain-containing protein [Dichomitus squalens]|uniref:Cortical protein marker for cell polarity-domain-containing protein n=1 Tax=Dichomitus squalens TaxID=114155 RepID=A0A4Q9MP90_9APHY|nr:cortical protein marker for cell polarity-domain-containing protein [Dichomitus squalens]
MACKSRRRTRHSSRAVTLLALALSAHVVLAASDSPLVDFNRMGKVGLAGAFAGLDLVDNSTSVTFDPTTASLLSRSSDGSLSKIASTNPGGSVLAGCAVDDVFYFAGSFTSVGSTTAANVASYSSSQNTISSLGQNGPDGVVHTLFCDSSRKQVWAGGQFSSPGASVAVWDIASSSWSAAPFGGLTGAAAEVLSITSNSSQSSLYISGSFIASFGNGTVAINGTHNPNVPFSTGATPFSSSLVPVPLQGAQIDAGPSSSDSDFSNINNTLCPAGSDGPGNTWFAADGTKAVITVRKFSFLTARGIRIGNTFLDGRGTTAFSVATIPDNTVQQLHYFDPTANQNKSCTDSCPLLTDPNVPYQDFLFDSDLDVTGFQLTLSAFKGDGAGLHLLQLLSSGAFASAVDGQNGQSCFAPGPSSTLPVGTWTVKQADTSIAGTVQQVLVSDVDVGTSQADGPSFTWMPYVSASGEYDINLLVPGCTNFQDCPLRTSVQVTVFPGGGQNPWVTNISQQNTQDSTTLIYRGPIVPTTPQFQTTITMELAEDPKGSGQNGKYELVADRVQLILTSANTTSSNSSSSGSNTTSITQQGFGFLEWPLSSTSTVASHAAIPTSAITSQDNIGFGLLSALGGVNSVASTTEAVAAVAQHPSGALFLGGKFSLTLGSANGASNIAVYKNGALTALSNNGLNGAVTSLVVDGDNLYVGGSFSDTAQASNSALKGVAVYSVSGNTWSALEGGVNGAVTSLDVANNQILVAGNFTELLNSSGGTTDQNAGGFATWDVSSGSWVNSGGFLVGSMTFVGNGTSANPQFVAGSVTSSLKFGASGLVMLQNGQNGKPEVVPLGVQFDASNAANSTPATVIRRSHHRRSATSWIPNLNVMTMFKRQTQTTLAPLPSAAPAPAPAVLAGVFWTNSSASKEVVIIGGNFSYTAGGVSAENIAIYDANSKTAVALKGNQPNGTIRALHVKGNSLYVGGEFTIQGVETNGFAIYDLANQRWDQNGVDSLQAGSGSSVVVRSISDSPADDHTVVVAGSFAQAGSTPCRAICSLDSTSRKWSALGNGIQGDVSAVVYAGSDTLIAAGSIALADSTHANVASYELSNSTWSSVGDGSTLPGPVTAVEVDNNNKSAVFAAGRASDGSSSFLYFWDGKNWNSVGSTLESTTEISQLTMVPLQNTHASNGIIEPDRVLMISGTLSDSSFGNASSALFDGATFIPYVVSTSQSGAPGTVAGLFRSFATFSFTQKHFLATGVVILISIAIGAGIVFLLALIEILWTLFARRDDKVGPVAHEDFDTDDDSTHRPSSLLEHINAATRSTILGAQSPFGLNAEKEAGYAVAAGAAAHDDPFSGPDGSNYVRAETPSDALGGGLDGEEQSRPAYARYSFDGRGDGELALRTGQELEILDDRDAAWWYARDSRTGQEGVVPAAYVY